MEASGEHFGPRRDVQVEVVPGHPQPRSRRSNAGEKISRQNSKYTLQGSADLDYKINANTKNDNKIIVNFSNDHASARSSQHSLRKSSTIKKIKSIQKTPLDDMNIGERPPL